MFNFKTALFLFTISFCATKACGTDYYMDSRDGDDANAGTSENTAWKSLEKANSVVLKPGDRMLFRSGSAWKGQICPKGEGAEGSPIVITRFGAGRPPMIEGDGSKTSALLLKNQSWWEISNLELTNNGLERNIRRRGVHILAEDCGSVKHVVLKNLLVRNVSSSLDGGDTEMRCHKLSGGIHFEVAGNSVPTRFEGICVEGCSLRNVDWTGIFTSSSWGGRKPDDSKYFPSIDVLVRGNSLDDIGRDGITIRAAKAPLIEFNSVFRANQRSNVNACGIWSFACENTLIQFNEVYATHCEGKIKDDGQGFDADGQNHGTVIQYNYSHDNEGGFVLICNNRANGEFNSGIVVRGNVSQNDRSNIFRISSVNSAEIYRNIVFVDPLSPKPTLFRFNNFGGSADGINIHDNVFCNLGPLDFVNAEACRNVLIHDNIYCGTRKANSVETGVRPALPEPEFKSPGGASIGIETAKDAYSPAPGSTFTNYGFGLMERR